MCVRCLKQGNADGVIGGAEKIDHGAGARHAQGVRHFLKHGHRSKGDSQDNESQPVFDERRHSAFLRGMNGLLHICNCVNAAKRSNAGRKLHCVPHAVEIQRIKRLNDNFDGLNLSEHVFCVDFARSDANALNESGFAPEDRAFWVCAPFLSNDETFLIHTLPLQKCFCKNNQQDDP
jgi:hypothetical protein